MFSWGGHDWSHDHMPPMPRWKFTLYVAGWCVAFGAILVWMVA